ncbi:unnamed protein product [Mycena citricolor]|uniref:Mannoprotein n=1 Tax=Mycena citricolor TaxID=2018698 RepID=A0AAD2I1R4_9AGAR|nr:unnamed protein product [Mycena citricolor]
MSLCALLFLAGSAAAASSSFPEGVIATGTQGVTNPPVATMGTAVNQSSDARLLSINSVDDFCIFAPPALQDIGNSETFEVAWCTKPRNNARVIPDGTLTGVSFLKTPFYVQIMGYGDFTKLNIPAGDFGGELDPHGATGAGNPVGGNVTTNIVDGVDEPLAEWMMFIDYNQFCLRACTNANSTYSSAFMCWHELDEMGCDFNMPGNYNFNGTFETCDADVAYPPGWYPTSFNGATPVAFSTFAQRFTYTATNNGVATPVTIGDLVTPTTVYFTPSSSNCVTTATISNGLSINGAAGATPAPSGSSGASGSQSGAAATTGGAAATGSHTTSAAASTASGKSAGFAEAAFDVKTGVLGLALSLFAMVLA